MVGYRRFRRAGGSYFFTLTLRNRRSRLLTDHVNTLRRAFQITQAERPFTIDAIVVLPEHLHAIWTLPKDDDDFPGRWRRIKSEFVQGLRKGGLRLHSNRRGEYSVWQRRYWEHYLRDQDDFIRHCDYIHYNPVKHGYVSKAIDWAWSSFHRYVAAGKYPADWGSLDPNIEGATFGE